MFLFYFILLRQCRGFVCGTWSNLSGLDNLSPARHSPQLYENGAFCRLLILLELSFLIANLFYIYIYKIKIKNKKFPVIFCLGGLHQPKLPKSTNIPTPPIFRRQFLPLILIIKGLVHSISLVKISYNIIIFYKISFIQNIIRHLAHKKN